MGESIEIRHWHSKHVTLHTYSAPSIDQPWCNYLVVTGTSVVKPHTCTHTHTGSVWCWQHCVSHPSNQHRSQPIYPLLWFCRFSCKDCQGKVVHVCVHVHVGTRDCSHRSTASMILFVVMPSTTTSLHPPLSPSHFFRLALMWSSWYLFSLLFNQASKLLP